MRRSSPHNIVPIALTSTRRHQSSCVETMRDYQRPHDLLNKRNLNRMMGERRYHHHHSVEDLFRFRNEEFRLSETLQMRFCSGLCDVYGISWKARRWPNRLKTVERDSAMMRMIADYPTGVIGYEKSNVRLNFQRFSRPATVALEQGCTTPGDSRATSEQH